MPRIPDYEAAGTSVPRASTPRFPADRSAGIEAEGQETLLGAVGALVDQAVQHDDKLRYAAARGTILKADADARESLRNDADPYTYETRYRENLSKAKQRAAQEIRGRQSRALFEADIDADIERGAGQIREIARTRITDQNRARLQETLDSSLRNAQDAPDDGTSIASIQTGMTAIQAAVDQGDIDAVAGERLRASFREDVAEGRVSLQPLDKRIELLSKPKGTVAEAIRPDRRAAMLQRSQEEKRVLEAREQALQDRREAKAERAVLQLEQQIASGVPLNDEMGKRWAKAVKGTSFEAEFQQVQRSEAQVQDMLRKPIGEQLRFVQEREAQLTKEGGSLRDIANFGRLKRAVQGNIEDLQRTPLLYLQKRTGEEFAPLDFRALADGDPDQGALLDDRVTALNGARARVGGEVPLRPLLPQEVQQLSALLQTSTPRVQAELLAAVHQNFRDPKAFEGAMQQIAPDAPVKAFAGRLAAKEAKQTITERWFTADEAVSSAEVAQTLLEGEALLNPTAAEKSQDGDPKLGLYLPAQTMLQDSFTEAVGDAFRGRPGAADLAYQVAKAYYVGRAVQTGRVASSKDDVDEDLLGEAITATLGAVVDYNSAGNVLAPWGMDADKFEDRAAMAFRVEGLRRGMSEERIEELVGDIGLQNTGGDGNKYRVTVGNNFLTDTLGTPFVIEVPEDYETPEFLRPDFKPYERK